LREGSGPVVLRLLPWMLPAVLLAAWGLAGKTGWMPGYLLPEPGRIAGSFSLYLFGQAGSAPYAGRFSIDAAASLARGSMGFAAAVLLGVPLGGRATSARISPCRSPGSAVRSGNCWERRRPERRPSPWLKTFGEVCVKRVSGMRGRCVR